MAGIEIMAAEAEELHEEGEEEQLLEMNANISVAFCALAELYLTDLWSVYMPQIKRLCSCFLTLP